MRGYKITFLIIFSFGMNLNSTTTAAFLKFPNDARVISAGCLYDSQMNEFGAVLINPAINLSYNQNHIRYTRSVLFDDISYNNFLYFKGISNGTIGFIMNYNDNGIMEGRDISGNKISDFGSKNKLVGLNYSQSIGNNTFGINLKYISLNIADEKADTFAFDLGYKSYIGNKIGFGISVENIGRKVKFIDEKENLPSYIHFGLTYNISGFLLSINTNKMIYTNEKSIIFSMEYPLFDSLYLRGGYNTLDFDNKSSFNMGLGIKLRNFNLDYGIISRNYTKLQSMTLGVRF